MVKIFGKSYGELKATVERKLGADRIRGYKVKEAEKGNIDVGYGFSERVPHPSNMDSYEEWSKDPEASIALEVLTGIISGVGFYTEMPDEVPEEERLTHPNKLKIDEYAESVNLDEKLNQNVWQSITKGFSPAEKIVGFDGQIDLKTLPAESFYMYRDKKGTLLKYTQERSAGDVITEWKGAEMDDVIRFVNDESPLRPYGYSILDPIGELLEGRAQLNVDVMKGVHRWANPIPIMETVKSKSNSVELKEALNNRDVDEWVLIYDVAEGEMRWTPLTVTPAKDFISFVDLLYTQICEGLHAPLLLYLKNATEASATVMMESVDRFVNGKQRYFKRRIEKGVFEALVGEPVPRLIWGKPQTGLEKVTMTELAALVNSPALANNQKQELLKMYGVKLPEPDWKSGPPMPTFTPFGDKDKKPFGQDGKDKKQEPNSNMEFLVEKLNDLNTALNIIGVNFDEGKIPLTEVIRMAQRTIEAHMKRAYPVGWEPHVQEELQRFIGERVTRKSGKPSYRVTVD